MIWKRIALPPRTTVPLRDLGDLKPEWQGILSPVYDDELIASFLQAQFLENAEVYVHKYQNTDHWKELLRQAQRFFRIADPAPLILDIGSGGGNSVFPLLDLYPDATLVASDLSVPLLKILKDFLEQDRPDRPCVIMQLNAEQLVFEADQFDLVVGGSILHHLFTPDQTIRECHRVLKPGGVAVFFEPFEMGNQVLALGFKHLAELNRNPPAGGAPIEPEILKFFAAWAYDLEVRKGSDKSSPIYRHLDDKWLFTRRYFEEGARTAGFRRVVVAPLNPDENSRTPFSFQTEVLLRLGLGRDLAALPEWARCYLANLDTHFSPELIPELIIEGTIVLEK